MWWRVRSPTSIAEGAIVHEGSKATQLLSPLRCRTVGLPAAFCLPDISGIFESIPGPVSIHSSRFRLLRNAQVTVSRPVYRTNGDIYFINHTELVNSWHVKTNPGRRTTQNPSHHHRARDCESLTAAVGQDRRSPNQARPILLAAAGGGSSDAAAVWRHGTANRWADGGERVKRGDGSGEIMRPRR